MKYYTGVGSRQTPQEVLSVMEVLAGHLALKGYFVRSGGAQGADEAFRSGGKGMDQIFLPWPSFADIQTPFTRPTPEAFKIAAQYHPGWKYLSNGGRALHARNVHQVLGPDVEKPELSKFVICWTPKGKGGGGTGQAIRVAKGYDVPVHDLGDPECHVEHLPEIISRYF